MAPTLGRTKPMKASVGSSGARIKCSGGSGSSAPRAPVPAPLLDAIALEAAPRLHAFKPQELANLAWAFAALGHAAPALLDAIALEAAPRLAGFSPQGLVNLAWAYAKLAVAAPRWVMTSTTQSTWSSGRCWRLCAVPRMHRRYC